MFCSFCKLFLHRGYLEQREHCLVEPRKKVLYFLVFVVSFCVTNQHHTEDAKKIIYNMFFASNHPHKPAEALLQKVYVQRWSIAAFRWEATTVSA